MKKIFTKEEKETINSDIAAINEDMKDAIEIVFEYKKEKVTHFLFDENKDEPENEEELERFLDKLEGIQGMISEIKEIILLPKKEEVERSDLPKRRATKKAISKEEYLKKNSIKDGWYLDDESLVLQIIRRINGYKSKKFENNTQINDSFDQRNLEEMWNEYVYQAKNL